MPADIGMATVRKCQVVTVKFNLAFVRTLSRIELNINKIPE
jgi:hypothetical protein